MDNVVVTPHLGYVTHETLTAFYTDTLEAVVAFANGPSPMANDFTICVGTVGAGV